MAFLNQIFNGQRGSRFVIQVNLIYVRMVQLPVQHNQLMPALGKLQQFFASERMIQYDSAVNHSLRQ
ncbi:hypothetical protein D3C86_2206740 [compost metagenome]